MLDASSRRLLLPPGAARAVRVAAFFGADTEPAKQRVESLLARLPEKKRSLASLPRDARLELAEALPALEALQSKDEATSTSALLEGEWNFALVGTPPPTKAVLASPLSLLGVSPGVFGLSLLEHTPSAIATLRSLTATIRPSQPRLEVSSEVGLAGSSTGVSVQIFSKLEVQTGRRLLETWTDILVNGTSVALPAQLQFSRSLFVTFLDETMCVLRDEAGFPTILRRPAMPPPPPPPAMEAGPITITVDDEEAAS